MSQLGSIAAAQTPSRLLQVEHERVCALVIDTHRPDPTGLRLPPRLRALPGLADVPALTYPTDCAPDAGHRTAPWAFVGTFVASLISDGPARLVVEWVGTEVPACLDRPQHPALALADNARR